MRILDFFFTQIAAISLIALRPRAMVRPTVICNRKRLEVKSMSGAKRWTLY